MQYGIKNEVYFANAFNGKRVKDLPLEMQKLIYAIFDNVGESSIIECWRSHYLEKADIKIKINGNIKGISIKTGKNCSMHQENYKKFSDFLIKLGLNYEDINILHKFIIGKMNNKKVNSKIYIENNLNEIKLIRNKFNDYYIKTNLLIRFIIQGTEIQNYDCDALIHGTPDSFLWATKSEILKYLVDYNIDKYDFINISALNFKCYDRNLRNNSERKKHEEDIQIKWYTIKQDLAKITKLRNSKSS